LEPQDEIKLIFNQFIEQLALPVSKFARSNESSRLNKAGLNSFMKSHTNYSYRVTYKHIKFDQIYDEFIDDEQFAQWFAENKKKHRLPSLEYVF
jgi:hypothetical protein